MIYCGMQHICYALGIHFNDELSIHKYCSMVCMLNRQNFNVWSCIFRLEITVTARGFPQWISGSSCAFPRQEWCPRVNIYSVADRAPVCLTLVSLLVNCDEFKTPRCLQSAFVNTTDYKCRRLLNNNWCLFLRYCLTSEFILEARS